MTKSYLAPLLLLPILTKSEIRTFEGPLYATPEFIHYSEGFIVAPGYVDISNLVFKSLNEANDNSNRNLDGGRGLDVEPAIDIVVFREPRECTSHPDCDWTHLGIGTKSPVGDTYWCCWGDALDLEICKSRTQSHSPVGHLALNRTAFTGQYRSITIDTSGKAQSSSVPFGKLEQGKTGTYVLVIANCNPNGRNMTVQGKYVLMSDHGYLPGDLFGAMYFFYALIVCYGVLFMWYGVSMKCNEDSIIPIQQWILTTIGIGFMEVFFKAGDYWVWNEDGTRFWFAMYIGLLLGVSKQAISRCLVVMVSLGWGVVRDQLTQMRTIIALGTTYALVAAACDVLEILPVVENETLGSRKEQEVIDIITVLTFLVAAIDVTFYMWILDALSGTMQYS